MLTGPCHPRRGDGSVRGMRRIPSPTERRALHAPRFVVACPEAQGQHPTGDDGLTDRQREALSQRYRRGPGAPLTDAEGEIIQRFRARRHGG